MGRLSLCAVAVAVALVFGCTADADPYRGLSDEAIRYVIPDSAGWGSGELCPGDTDCSGSITPAVIEQLDWYPTSGFSVRSDASASNGTVTATLAITEAHSDGADGVTRLAVKVWSPDIDVVDDVLDDGVEIWAGVDRSIDYVVVFVAFDAEGRLAGIGNAAAEYFTVPVARLAADADAPSGVEFLHPLMTQ